MKKKWQYLESRSWNSLIIDVFTYTQYIKPQRAETFQTSHIRHHYSHNDTDIMFCALSSTHIVCNHITIVI